MSSEAKATSVTPPEETKKADAVMEEPKTPPVAEEKKDGDGDAKKENGEKDTAEKENGENEDESKSPGKGKRKGGKKAAAAKKEATPKSPTPKKEATPKSSTPKSTTPKKETPSKRKESPAHTMETRTRKKVREAVDLVTGVQQRATSLINFLGSDYDSDTYTGPSEAQLKMMFRVFDRDNDGHIGSEELAEVLRSMGKRPMTKKIQKMLDECDTNKSGTIELEEFVTYMRKKAAKKAEGLRNKTKSKGKEKEAEPEAEKEEEEDKGKKGKGKGKGKKAAGKKGKASATVTTTTTSTEAEVTPSKPARGSSIFDFYTSHAGLQESNGPVDKYNNPEGAEYDLGVEGAFTAYKILAGLFYDAAGDSGATTMTAADFKSRVGGALQSKGFTFDVVTTQKDFITKVADYDEAWIISHKALDNTTTDVEFADEVAKFHDAGGGLFIWGDNNPWLAQANVALKKLFGTELTGNMPADKTIQVGDPSKPGFFAQHLITSGIKFLFEGRTVSYPVTVPDTLKVLAKSTDNTAVILHSDNTKLPPTSGRVVVDCGFTKLWVQWDSAGTERYVKNASVWLLGIDNRIAIDAPLVGKLQKQAKIEKAIWQFKHGGWHNYDKEASDIVEAAYQDWKSNPYTDVRSVKSGVWHYMVDFRQMKQTNVEHQAHTQRDIQRIVQQVYQ